jgi:hypothetical protein
MICGSTKPPKYKNWSFMLLACNMEHYQINKNRYLWEIWEIRTKVIRETLKERKHLQDLGVDGRMIIKFTLRKYCGKMLVLLVKWTADVLLCARPWTSSCGGLNSRSADWPLQQHGRSSLVHAIRGKLAEAISFQSTWLSCFRSQGAGVHAWGGDLFRFHYGAIKSIC